MDKNMKKGWFLALFCCYFLHLSSVSYASNDYQQQITDAKEHNTITINNKTIQDPIYITKPIHLILTNTTLEQPIHVEANNVIIEGGLFTGKEGIVASNIRDISIKDSQFQTTNEPILIKESQNIKIQNISVDLGENHYSNLAHGITIFDSKDISLLTNEIRRTQDAIYIENSENIKIIGNELEKGRYGTHLMYVKNVEITNNEIQQYITAIMAMESENIAITNNLLQFQDSLNSSAITLYQTNKGVIFQNLIKENSKAIQLQQIKNFDIVDNQFWGNVLVLQSIKTEKILFENNQLQANVLTVSSQTDGITLSHNMYDDYSGDDVDGDGIGDSPYRATTTFGQWVLQNPQYQYFIGGSSTMLLEKLDTNSSANILQDDYPKVNKHVSWTISFKPFYFVVGILLLFVLWRIWRKLR